MSEEQDQDQDRNQNRTETVRVRVRLRVKRNRPDRGKLATGSVCGEVQLHSDDNDRIQLECKTGVRC